MFWKLSRWSGNFLVGLEMFRMILKVSRWSRNFPDGLTTFQMVFATNASKKCVNRFATYTFISFCNSNVPKIVTLCVNVSQPESFYLLGLCVTFSRGGWVGLDISDGIFRPRTYYYSQSYAYL